MKVLLSTAYWPNLEYFYYLVNNDLVSIEAHENFVKQTFRNRSIILTANGPLALIIPVRKKAPKMLIQETEISYSENWQINHWRAITSAYRGSPYFDFLADEIHFFYSRRIGSLFEYNMQQLNTVFKILKVTRKIDLTAEYENTPENMLDLREKIHPKNSQVTEEAGNILSKKYYQTFDAKFGFMPNPSILDLIFNTGLESIPYLKGK